jgi:hypothetical protein
MRTIIMSDISGASNEHALDQDPLAFLGGDAVKDPEQTGEQVAVQ